MLGRRQRVALAAKQVVSKILCGCLTASLKANLPTAVNSPGSTFGFCTADIALRIFAGHDKSKFKNVTGY
jgi:hypothetical protein